MSTSSGTDQPNVEGAVTSNAGENDREGGQGSNKQPTIIDAKHAANMSDELLSCAPVLMDTWEAKKPVKRNPPVATDPPTSETPEMTEVTKPAEDQSKPGSDKEPITTDKEDNPVQNGVHAKHEEPKRTPEELTPDAISARKEARIKSLEQQIKLQREKAKLSCQRLEQATKLLDIRRKALEDAERKAREAERRITAMTTVLAKTKDPDYDVTSTLSPPEDKKAKEAELRQISGDMKSIEDRSSSASQSTDALEAKMTHLRAEIEKWKGRRDELKNMRDEQKALLAEIPKLTQNSDDTDQPPPPPPSGTTE